MGLWTLLVGQTTELSRRLRKAAGKDVRYRIGLHDAILPPEHNLPVFQEAHPLYDRYFIEFFRRLEKDRSDLCFIDIGANVGDTTLAVLSGAPSTRVVCVEGSPYFLKYLRTNVNGRQNVQIIDKFVAYDSRDWSFDSDGSTGRLVSDGTSPISRSSLLTPSELLELSGPAASVVWKSDTDGHDIPILLESFDEILANCDVVWIEFDPLINVTGLDDVQLLIERIGSTSKDVIVFDNFGHRLLHLSAQDFAKPAAQLVNWLKIQHSVADQRVHYLDLWILDPTTAEILVATT